MQIDIIDLTQIEFKDLSKDQFSLVVEAQIKKNGILRELAAEKRKLYFRCLERNTVRSNVRIYEGERLDAAAEKEIGELRDKLVQDIYCIAEGAESEGSTENFSYPDNPNYGLPMSQRYLVVRTYYLNKESDAAARLQMYAMDTVAKTYLGDYYETLYEYFAQLAK